MLDIIYGNFAFILFQPRHIVNKIFKTEETVTFRVP